MAIIPTVITSQGMQPQSPAALRAQLLASVSAVNPGYTANLPAILIEDVSSTDVGSIVLCDQARVEFFNSLTPFGANNFVLNQLGQGVYGIPLGKPSNTNVYVVFTGSVGFVIPIGFTVSDGTYQYVVQSGGIIPVGGVSLPIYCLASLAGSWAVPANTVRQLITSVPSTITLSVANPTAGTPGTGVQTAEDYRSEVLQAGLAASQGMTRYLKTLLVQVLGVQQRLISARMQIGGGWEIIAGGGDPIQVGNAIFNSLFDISTLTGSVMRIVGISNGNPGVVTTDLNHGYSAGQTVVISQSNPDRYDGGYIVTPITEKTFSIGVNTIGYPVYGSGGILTPNLRNVIAQINDYPDVYAVPFVVPPEQTVTIVVTWNTTATGITVSDVAMAQAANPALVSYVNSIYVGQPMNQFELISAFQLATASILPTAMLTRLVFAVSINGIGTPVDVGTGLIFGDPESYFYSTAADIVIMKG